MTEERAGACSRTSRIIKARPEQLYEAFIDPAALPAWLPPAGMTGKIHEFDARVEGGYRMSLFYPPNERNQPLHPTRDQSVTSGRCTRGR